MQLISTDSVRHESDPSADLDMGCIESVLRRRWSAASPTLLVCDQEAVHSSDRSAEFDLLVRDQAVVVPNAGDSERGYLRRHRGPKSGRLTSRFDTADDLGAPLAARVWGNVP